MSDVCKTVAKIGAGLIIGAGLAKLAYNAGAKSGIDTTVNCLETKIRKVKQESPSGRVYIDIDDKTGDITFQGAEEKFE